MTSIAYLILNGPPGAGKTTLARILSQQLRDMAVDNAQDSFAAPFKHFFAVALGDKWQSMDKSKARPELNGYSLRECWIDIAEAYTKKRFGDDIFGRWLVHRSLRDPSRKVQVVVVDDGGFIPEIEAVPNRFVVQVRRPGYDFTGDSRQYYPNPQLHYLNATTENFMDRMKNTREICESFINAMGVKNGNAKRT